MTALPSLRERAAQFLEGFGYTINKTALKRHWVATKPDLQAYYLGSRGSVRRGRTLTDSLSVLLNLPPL